MKTYYLESLGCAKNLVDSESFAAILERAGYQALETPEGADLVLVNTCSFLRDSLHELDLVLAELAELKNSGSCGNLLVTGCVTKRGLEEFQRCYPEVDAWIPLKDFAALERYLELPGSGKTERKAITHSYYRYLRISDGCSNHCSYCAIPSIRGEMQSVPIPELVEEAERLAADSDYPAQELIVIAQDTASYGMDIYGRKALPELLEKLHAIPQFQWIRVMYLHPDHFETGWLELWKRLPKLLPSFEIPIQHSEDGILSSMRRKLGGRELIQMFHKIRESLPQAVLRTTLICGYPGEKRRHAQTLQRFIREVRFLHLGAFVYSPEEGTLAIRMEGQVPARTAKNRRNRLLALQSEISAELLQQYVGQTLPVLIEDFDEHDEEGMLQGRAWFQAPEVDGLTFVEPADVEPGKIYPVLVTDVIDMDLFGRIVI